MQLKTGLAAVIAAAPFAQAGSAYIYNNCAGPVYLWAVDAVRNPGAPSQIAPGSSYSEQYHTLSTGGVSLKLAQTANIAKITQLEYTLTGGFIWYDGSNVNCQTTDCPFYAEGMHLETSVSSCPTRTCLPNTDCNGFYINYNDDWNSLSCQPDADVKLYLCSTSASGGTGGSAPAASSAPQPSAAVVTASPASSPAAVASVVSSAPSAESSAVHRMEAPAPYHGGHRMVKKVRHAEIDARDLHAHMRRHNHKRSH